MISIAAFSGAGEALAGKLAEAFENDIKTCRIGREMTLAQWTEQEFFSAEALIFIGACGIAVRAVSKFLKDKSTDPAVVVLDEKGQYAIPILSGHLGGANKLAEEIEKLIGVKAVITTATDINDVFAVDLWAKKQGCILSDIGLIKRASSTLLEGRSIYLESEFSIEGEPPENVKYRKAGEGNREPDVVLGIHSAENDVLCVIPKIAAIGIGARRGVKKESVKKAVEAFLAENRIDQRAILGFASIDLKKDETGILEYCSENGFDITFFTAEELEAAEGEFSSSEFVKEVTGTDNVCERSAVCLSKGTIAVSRKVYEGVTLALAVEPRSFDWSYK